jgi:hypothetical protein
MLDRATIDYGRAKIAEFDCLALSKIERRLIGFYRQLTEEDRKQLRRLAEALATIPDEAAS